jgi:hypothetical protein
MFIALYGCGTGPDTGTPSPTPSPTPTPTDLSSLTLSVSSSSVTFGTPVTASATVRNASGALLANTVVTFAPASAMVVFTPTSATALTGDGTVGKPLGVATITLNAASFDSAGATSITASAPVTTGGTTSTITSTPVGIAVNRAAVTLGTLTLGQPSISAYGTSSVSVPVLVGGLPATVPISVTFTSSCVANGKATLTTPVATILGTATSTYKDNNCASGTDRITASVTGNTAFVDIAVVLPAANNIQFVSATPAIIGTSTASSATLPKSSLVKFKVVDNGNNGKAGVLVDFSLLSIISPGGITFSTTQATSDGNGEVTTSVTSGTVPTSVWVVAKIHDAPTILTQSNMLTITTGLPAQNFFSLSVSTYNIEGWNYDGATSTLTIIASDRVGNPVPDGTAINFITEGGQIIPASCTTGPPNASGTCTVTFKSSEFKPADGRVTILAYAAGEKSFLDTIVGNNSYDAGETFYDLGDLYIDANENGHWDTGELFISPSSGGGTAACLTQPGGTALPFNYSNVPSKDNTCNAAWGINYVRRSAVLIFSGSTAYTSSPTTVSMGSLCSKTFSFWLHDINNNPMPAGTKVTLENEAIYYTSSSGATWNTTNTVGGTPVSNSTNTGGTLVSLTVDGTSIVCEGVGSMPYPKGTVNMVITTPNGVKTYIPITVN